MIKAILMDLDGVLVSACDWHYIALNKALNEVSGTIINKEEHETTFNGLPTREKLEILYNQGRVRPEDGKKVWERKQHYTKETIVELAKNDLVKKELHNYTKSLNILSVCVTNSITETTELMLKCTGQKEFMEFIISNEMVNKPKPHPEGYIRAMIKLGFMPDECIVVEDSPVGLEAANLTGAYVWQVRNCDDVTKENLISFLDGIKCQ